MNVLRMNAVTVVVVVRVRQTVRREVNERRWIQFELRRTFAVLCLRNHLLPSIAVANTAVVDIIVVIAVTISIRAILHSSIRL